MNLVFDFGAVLFDWQPAELVRRYFPEQCAHDEAASALAKAIFHHPDWQAFDQGLVQLPDVMARTAARLALPPPGVHRLMDQIGERLTPMPPSIALLEQMRQLRDARTRVAGEPLKLYFLSNMPAPYARVLEARHDFLQWFDGGVFSGDVELIKPDPAIYRLLAQRHGLVPGRTVFIDDLAANVAAAQGLGWLGIQFQDAPQLRRELRALGL